MELEKQVCAAASFFLFLNVHVRASVCFFFFFSMCVCSLQATWSPVSRFKRWNRRFALVEDRTCVVLCFFADICSRLRSAQLRSGQVRSGQVRSLWLVRPDLIVCRVCPPPPFRPLFAACGVDGLMCWCVDMVLACSLLCRRRRSWATSGWASKPPRDWRTKRRRRSEDENGPCTRLGRLRWAEGEGEGERDRERHSTLRLLPLRVSVVGTVFLSKRRDCLHNILDSTNILRFFARGRIVPLVHLIVPHGASTCSFPRDLWVWVGCLGRAWFAHRRLHARPPSRAYVVGCPSTIDWFLARHEEQTRRHVQGRG